MVDKSQTEGEREMARRIEAAYISDELKDAREIARENARLKKELEEAKKRIEKIDEEVILKTRDVVEKIFSSTPASIRSLATDTLKKQ